MLKLKSKIFKCPQPRLKPKYKNNVVKCKQPRKVDIGKYIQSSRALKFIERSNYKN